MGGERAAHLFYLCTTLPEAMMEAYKGVIPNVPVLS